MKNEIESGLHASSDLEAHSSSFLLSFFLYRLKTSSFKEESSCLKHSPAATNPFPTLSPSLVLRQSSDFWSTSSLVLISPIPALVVSQTVPMGQYSLQSQGEVSISLKLTLEASGSCSVLTCPTSVSLITE